MIAAGQILNLDVELRAIDALGDPDCWPEGAACLLEHLGFVVLNGSHPEAPLGSHLLVALRHEPELTHFDAEVVRYFGRDEDGHVRVLGLDRGATGFDDRGRRRVLWGPIVVADRRNVENRFLVMGGELRWARIDATLTVLDLRSPGPIVRWGGHSQGSDWLAGAIGAFFGRLRGAVLARAGVEERLAAAPARVLYSAFVAEAASRLDRIVHRLGLQRGASAWMRGEARRLRAADPGSWSAGRALLRELDLGPPDWPPLA